MDTRYIPALVSLLFITTCYADDLYPIKEVTTGIYYHQGIHQDANEENMGEIANVGFIVGEKCVAVIDSGGSYLEGRANAY